MRAHCPVRILSKTLLFLIFPALLEGCITPIVYYYKYVRSTFANASVY